MAYLVLAPEHDPAVGLATGPVGSIRMSLPSKKRQIQALDRMAPLLPLRPGFPERQPHDYRRYGTTTLFAAFNILTGKVIGTCQARHRGREFVQFLRHLEQEVPTAPTRARPSRGG